jgi:hypothetical protein
VIEWAEGSPLALALAAEAAAADLDWIPEPGAETPEIVRSLTRRLAESELGGVRPSALAVAAIARVTTVELLRAVLHGADADEAYERLRALTFTEPLGDGIAPHELVRRALHADLRRRDQERERELRRRIVDHLYECARRGDPLISIEMAHLIENPAIRWGFGWEGSIDYRIDDLAPGDAERVAELLESRRFGAWWSITRRFFEEAPERVAIARDRDDRLSGYLVCMTPGDNENEKLLRRVLIHGYLEPAPSHEQAAIDLSLSRAAYFRRLRAAVERLAEFLAGH